MRVSGRGIFRLLCRSSIELLLALAGMAIYGALLSAGERRNALIGLCAGLGGAVMGLLMLHRSGSLLLALRCPRLDALGLRAGSRSAPWTTLRAADDALRTLDEEGRGYRDFFPEARRDLLAAAFRAIESHRQLVRAEGALLAAPEEQARPRGGAGQLLRDQAERAELELHALTRTLRDLRARLIASTAPQHSVPDALPSLRALEERSEALAQAGEEVQLRVRSLS